ncbi:hypothetical protein ACLBOM_37430 [Escherichia coli]
MPFWLTQPHRATPQKKKIDRWKSTPYRAPRPRRMCRHDLWREMFRPRSQETHRHHRQKVPQIARAVTLPLPPEDITQLRKEYDDLQRHSAFNPLTVVPRIRSLTVKLTPGVTAHDAGSAQLSRCHQLHRSERCPLAGGRTAH